jgi:hypothetical protein
MQSEKHSLKEVWEAAKKPADKWVAVNEKGDIFSADTFEDAMRQASVGGRVFCKFNCVNGPNQALYVY